MLLDDLLPDYDATRIEHRVIDAPALAAYAATRTLPQPNGGPS